MIKTQSDQQSQSNDESQENLLDKIVEQSLNDDINQITTKNESLNKNDEEKITKLNLACQFIFF